MPWSPSSTGYASRAEGNMMRWAQGQMGIKHFAQPAVEGTIVKNFACFGHPMAGLV